MGTPRARRGLPLIAAALTAIVVVGFVWLRAGEPQPAPGLGAVPRTRLVDAPYVVGYDFLSPSLGWAVATEGATGERTWVFRTTDGAQHWQKVFAGPLAPPGAEIQMFDRSHGFISKVLDHAVVYQTVDGGAHWQAMNFPAPPINVTFGDAMHVWFVSLGH